MRENAADVMPSEARLIAVIGWVATAVALTAALALPVGYVLLAFRNQASHTDLHARVEAAEINALIGHGQWSWAQVMPAIEELLTHQVEADDCAASVYDADGIRLLRVGVSPEWPRLHRSHALHDSEQPVGRVEIERSLRPVLYGTMTAALFGLLLGAAVFLALRLPTRALGRITKNLERERALLRESEDCYRTVASFTHDWEYWLAADGSLPYVSPSCEEATGYGAEEFQRDPGLMLRIVHADDRERVWNHFRASTIASAIDDGHHEQDFRIVTRDGEVRWISHVCRAVFGSSGQYLGRRASNRDITQRKRAEEELRVAAAAFDAQEGIVVTDAKMVVIRVNRAFEEITGYAPSRVVGRTPRFISTVHHDSAFFAGVWDSIRRTGSWKGELWIRRRSGETFPGWATISAVKTDDRVVTRYVGTLTDITQRKAAEAAITHLAFYDPLTQLPNRRLLLDRLQHAVAASARGCRHGAVVFIDLDNFKTLNDTRGHDVGDLLLQDVAQRLLRCVREGDTVARFGGDEYVVVLEQLSEHRAEAAAQAEAVGEKVLSIIGQPYVLAGQEHHGSASVGISLFVHGGYTVDDLLKQADLAMYKAKAAGRGTLRFFDPQMQATVTARVAMETELRRALQEHQFLLLYQPQVDFAGHLTGVEALVRWRHPERGIVAPSEFIPLAEDTGLILPLGRWVLESACAQLAAWAAKSETADLAIAVNVSAREFRHPDFARCVIEALERTAADPRKLTLEFTESLLLDDMDDAIAKMGALKARGIRLSLDDFGTGYSSLRYVKHLPLDQLKIDQSFVRDVLTDANDAAIARAILALGQSLDLSVIAEGIESAAQRDYLASNGCRAFQGYLFGRPVRGEALRVKRSEAA